MPLILTENEASESGITYEDRTGISYQYPKMYRRTVQSGERFVYYRGRGRKNGRRGPQVYFGSGVVGEIAPDPSVAGRLVCRILDYRPFPAPVPFKEPGGNYRERGGSRSGYYQRGVRTITSDEFVAILDAANADSEFAKSDGGPTQPTHVVPGPRYASPEKLRAIETFAIGVAVEEIARRYPGVKAHTLPRNNPGFDIELGLSDGPIYVEVKGTERATPVFFATEGELQFSRRNASRYRLIVVYGINLTTRSYTVAWNEGSISSDAGFLLRPVQWACELDGAPAPMRTDMIQTPPLPTPRAPE